MLLHRAAIRYIPIRFYARSLTSRNILAPDPGKELPEKTKEEQLQQQQQQQFPGDKPWDGEESVVDSVIRLVMDKYNKPLRVEGAARRNLPNPQTHPDQVEGLYSISSSIQEEEEAGTLSSGEKAALRAKAASAKKQKRLIDAKESALDYSLGRKYPPTTTTTKKTEEKEPDDDDQEWHPRSINEGFVLSEERIREAKANGLFDDLPGRGKPIPEDINLNNPFLDRTEYFLNRIIQRQGAAPPWIMMQQEVNTEVTRFRADIERSVKLCLTVSKTQTLTEWHQKNGGYYKELVEKINGRIRSYNVMCPSPVRRLRLDLESEVQDVYDRLSKKKQ